MKLHDVVDLHTIFMMVVAGIILAGGSLVALLWWRLPAKAAPYKDELESAKPSPTPEVHVIPSDFDRNAGPDRA
jgi:hypothetical protein